jgi:hypothetical protein
VQPDALRGANVGDRRQRIDRTGVRRAGIRADGDRREAGIARSRQSLRESRGLEPVPVVGRQLDDGIPAHADDVRRPLDGGMRLVAHEHGRALRRARFLARRDERIEDGGGTPRREEAPGRRGIADPVADPADHHELELARPAGAEPRALEDVVTRREIVRDHARPGRRGRYKRKEARMIHACRDRKDLFDRALQYRDGIPSFLGRRPCEQRLELGPRRAAPGRRVPEARKPLEQARCRGVREAAHVRLGETQAGTFFDGVAVHALFRGGPIARGLVPRLRRRGRRIFQLDSSLEPPARGTGICAARTRINECIGLAGVSPPQPVLHAEQARVR